MVFQKRFTRLFTIVTICVVIQGCCKLPGVYCGPIISALDVQPRFKYLDTNQQILGRFKCWRYKMRDVPSSTVRLECFFETPLLNTVILENSNIYYLRGKQKQVAKQTNIVSEKLEKGKKQRIYSIEFVTLNDYIPDTIYLDKLMLVTASDTVGTALFLDIKRNLSQGN